MKIIPFLLFVIVFSTSCKKQSYLTFKNVLPLHQWRKTLEAVYNKNNEFEKPSASPLLKNPFKSSIGWI